MNIVIFGPPGAGKGTQSKFIVKKFNMFQLSTGEFLRNEMLKKTLVHGHIKQEGPQKVWDPNGRKLYSYKNMVVVTNYEQNRIVTVYWKIPDWSNLEKINKI